MCLCLCGCFENEYETVENEIELTIPDEYLPYLPYEEVPSYKFEFEGKLNISPKVKNSNEVYFVTNDDFFLSEIISSFLKDNEAKGTIKYVTVSEEEKSETRMNTMTVDDEGKAKLKSHKMNVIDRKIFNKLAYVSLDNGLSLSLNFRTFVSDYSGEEKTYYAWQYNGNSHIRLYLHYPFIVNKNEEGKIELILIPLPTGISYAVGTNLALKNVLESDSWLNEQYRKFRYYGYNDEIGDSSINLEESIKEVKSYYISNFEGKDANGVFSFTYLGKSFEINFDSGSFQINYID